MLDPDPTGSRALDPVWIRIQPDPTSLDLVQIWIWLDPAILDLVHP